MDKPITLCDRCDIYMSCLLNYDGPACRRNRTVEPTNADRIRAMSDEELADYAYKVLGNYCCPPEREHATRSCIIDMKEDCDNCWLDWLRQEAT